MSKSTNRRKSIAIALAVLGVAGLSLASAAQLNLSGSASVQSGTLLALNTDCQPETTPITVAFSAPVPTTGAPKVYASTTVNVASIAAACQTGHKYKLALLDGGNNILAGNVETALSSGTLSIAIPAGEDNNIKTVALTIYS